MIRVNVTNRDGVLLGQFELLSDAEIEKIGEDVLCDDVEDVAVFLETMRNK